MARGGVDPPSSGLQPDAKPLSYRAMKEGPERRSPADREVAGLRGSDLIAHYTETTSRVDGLINRVLAVR